MKASNEMYVPLDHRIRFSVRCASWVTTSVYMYVTKSKHEQTNSWVFGTLGKPSTNHWKLFLDGARNYRFVPEPKQIEITDKKNLKLKKMCQKSNMTQETFVSRVTFVKTMQTTFAKLKRTNILYVAIGCTSPAPKFISNMQRPTYV